MVISDDGGGVACLSRRDQRAGAPNDQSSRPSNDARSGFRIREIGEVYGDHGPSFADEATVSPSSGVGSSAPAFRCLTKSPHRPGGQHRRQDNAGQARQRRRSPPSGAGRVQAADKDSDIADASVTDAGQPV